MIYTFNFSFNSTQLTALDSWNIKSAGFEKIFDSRRLSFQFPSAER